MISIEDDMEQTELTKLPDDNFGQKYTFQSETYLMIIFQTDMETTIYLID